MVAIPEAVVAKEEDADRSSTREGFTPESDEMDESDVSRVKSNDDVIVSKDYSQISMDTSEYSNNTPLKNEKIEGK